MATNLPPFLVEYLLRQGLFSNRFSTPEDTQETPKKEQELTFEKVLQDILDGGLDTEDTTSVPSAPSPSTPSTGGLGLGDIGGLFGDIEQTLSDALSFDLGQAAIDAAEDATGLDLSFEGLFGMETPSFISDIQRAMPEAVTSAIMSSPNQSLGAKAGALGFNLLSPLIPAPISILGTAFNMMGATDPFDPARDVAFNFDPYSQVSTISPRASSLSEDEPDVARSELGFAADIADLAAEFGLDATISRGIGATVADYISDIGQFASLDFGTQFGMTPDFADFGVKGISGIDKLTTSALDTLGFGGGFGAPGAFSAQPDPTSPFGYAPDYHSPSFDPAGRDFGDPDMDFGDPSYDPGFDEPGGYGGADGPDGGNDDGGFDGGLGY